MKRISKITISNYKAYSQPTEINNLEGKNMLIYGENGSGKTSLFHALKHFMMSSTQSGLSFAKNIYIDPTLDGEIQIDFKEGDNTTSYVSSSNETKSTHKVSHITDAADSFGYLDYKLLLEFYLNKPTNPDLFDLVVIKLLGRYRFPTSPHITIADEWKKIDDLVLHSRTRATNKHKEGLKRLAIFDANLRSLLSELQNEVNRFLDSYFKAMNIHIEFDMEPNPISCSYSRHRVDWRINHRLCINVSNKQTPLHPRILNYTYNLNEARLSAIALCIYLASLRKMPQVMDFQLLILDDVFIGIDSGNRLPIMKLLTTEFSNYQILMTTYDRSWFHMAKDYVSTHGADDWKCHEFYEGKKIINNAEVIPYPIITDSDSNYSRAYFYFNHESHPDYPASANYLRKSLEEYFSKNMPVGAITTDEKTPVDAYRLTTVLIRAKEFFTQCKHFDSLFGDALNCVTAMQSMLHPLIHPLSHHVVDLPTYKSELQIVFDAINRLKELQFQLDWNNRVVCKYDKKTKFQFTLNFISGKKYIYELELTDNMYVFNGNLSKSSFHVTHQLGYDTAGVETQNIPISTSNSLYKIMCYDSFDAIVYEITKHWTKQGETDFIVEANIMDMFKIFQIDRTWGAIS